MATSLPMRISGKAPSLPKNSAPKMLSVCRRYARHSMEAEDLLQDAFVRVFDKLGTFRGDGSLEGWVRRIVVHACIRNYRKSSFKKEQFGMEQLPGTVVEIRIGPGQVIACMIPPQRWFQINDLVFL